MKTTWILLLLTGGLSVIALRTTTAGSSDLQPMVVKNLTGDLRMQQGIPCDNDVDQTTAVTQGRLELTPALGVDVPEGKRFALTRADVSFAPFSIHRDCLGFGETRHYTEIGVHLGRAVFFTATQAGPGVFDVTIPKDDFQIAETSIVNDNLENGVMHPKEDVTGTIDFGAGTVQMRVVVANKVHFEAGCVPIFGCLIDEDKSGTLTANISGTIAFPDADGDGISDQTDNCRFVPNPDQTPVATPVVTTPPGLTIASCADHQIGTATAADVCDRGAVILTNNAPGTFVLGPNLITWTGQDARTRVGTGTQTVTVVDTTAPLFTSVPPDITLNTCGPATLGLPTAVDDCAGTPVFKNNAPAKFQVGPTVVTWTATDVSQNRSTATQTVTVHDIVRPAVSCVATEDPNEDDDHGHHDRDHHEDDDDGFFRVSATDACAPRPVIRIGAFTLAKGEVIKITRTHRPGVRRVGDVGRRHIKRFLVGPGENVIAATDGSGNVASASCVVPRDHDRHDRGER